MYRQSHHHEHCVGLTPCVSTCHQSNEVGWVMITHRVGSMYRQSRKHVQERSRWNKRHWDVYPSSIDAVQSMLQTYTQLGDAVAGQSLHAACVAADAGQPVFAPPEPLDRRGHAEQADRLECRGWHQVGLQQHTGSEHGCDGRRSGRNSMHLM